MDIEGKVILLEQQQIRFDEREKSLVETVKRLEAAVKEYGAVVTAIEKIAVETKYMRGDLNEALQRLSTLEKKDIDKWEKFKWAVLVSVIAIVVAAIAAIVGLK